VESVSAFVRPTETVCLFEVDAGAASCAVLARTDVGLPIAVLMSCSFVASAAVLMMSVVCRSDRVLLA